MWLFRFVAVCNHVGHLIGIPLVLEAVKSISAHAPPQQKGGAEKHEVVSFLKRPTGRTEDFGDRLKMHGLDQGTFHHGASSSLRPTETYHRKVHYRKGCATMFPVADLGSTS